jgi:hypothetical protein
VIKVIVVALVNKMVGIGIRRTISISNTMKIMARRKNRIENGIRAVLLGSNPHSKGEDFSRSALDRVLKTHAAIRINKGRIRAISVEVEARFIN